MPSDADVIREQGQTIRRLRKQQERLIATLSGATGYIGFLAASYVSEADPEVEKHALDRCVAYREVIQEIRTGREDQGGLDDG